MSPVTSFPGLGGDVYDIGAPRYRGRFVTVYEAVKNGSVPVAVKELRNSKGDDNSDEYYYEGRLLEREWEISQSLRSFPHDHLLLVDDRFSTPDVEYYVMPLAEKDLASMMGKLTDDETLDIVRQLAKGMQELGAAGVLHRDIKPSNVLYWKSVWRLADFGVSKIDGNSGTATWMGTGTLDYWAPELFSGNAESLLTDMYSLGCLIFALRMGHPPFKGSSNLRRDHETAIPELDATVGPVLGRLVHRLMAKQPQARPQSPAEVLRLCGSVKSPLQEKFLQVELAYSRLNAKEEAERSRRQRIESLYLDAAARLEYVVEAAHAQLDEMSIDVTFAKDAPSSTWLLRLRRHQLSVKLAARHEWDRDYNLVCFAVLSLVREDDALNVDRPVGNLVCEETDGVLRWSIIRFRHEDSQSLFGIAKDEEFLRSYPSGWDANMIVLAERAELTAESLLELFSAVVLQALDREGGASTPAERRTESEMFAMFDPDLRAHTAASVYNAEIGMLLSGFGMGAIEVGRAGKYLDYTIRTPDDRLACVEVKYKERGQLVRKDLMKAVLAAANQKVYKVVVVANVPLSDEVRHLNSVGSMDGVEIEAVTWKDKNDTGVLQRVIARSFR